MNYTVVEGPPLHSFPRAVAFAKKLQLACKSYVATEDFAAIPKAMSLPETPAIKAPTRTPKASPAPVNPLGLGPSGSP